MKKINLIAVLFLAMMFFVPNTSLAGVYTLSNGDDFDGSLDEYNYAQLILKIDAEKTTILKDAWNKVSQKNKSLVLAKVISKATFLGDAGYDSAKKEFYVSNSKSVGRISFEVKHGLSRSKISKIINNFSKELEVTFDKYEKDSKIKKIKKIKKNSDLENVVESFVDSFYDVGYDLGINLRRTYINIQGVYNRFVKQPVLMYSDFGKRSKGFTGNITEDYYYDLEPVFDEELFFEESTVPYKPLYINIALDGEAEPGTMLTFKLKDVRGLSNLKVEDIWPDLYDVE